MSKTTTKGNFAGYCPNEECKLILIENEVICPKCGEEFKPAQAQTLEGVIKTDE